MRMVSDLNNNFLSTFESHPDAISKSYYFNDDNICYRYQWIYFDHSKADSVVNWLNSNFEKMPDDSMKWKDLKRNLTYQVIDSGNLFSLWCNADNYQQFNEEDDRIRVDFNILYGFDFEKEEWYEIYKGEWNTFDEVTGEMFEYNYSTDRFVIPRDLKGKIEHFRTQGKMRTYEILYPFNSNVKDDDAIPLIVKNEDDEEFMFVVHVDLEKVMLLYDDRSAKLFSND